MARLEPWAGEPDVVGRITSALAAPLDVADTTLACKGSVGWAVAATGDTVASLLARADADMYRRKASGHRDEVSESIADGVAPVAIPQE